MTDFDVESSLDQLKQLGVVNDVGGTMIQIDKKYNDRCLVRAEQLLGDKRFALPFYEKYPVPEEAYKQLKQQADILILMEIMGGKRIKESEITGMVAVLTRMREESCTVR